MGVESGGDTGATIMLKHAMGVPCGSLLDVSITHPATFRVSFTIRSRESMHSTSMPVSTQSLESSTNMLSARDKNAKGHTAHSLVINDL